MTSIPRLVVTNQTSNPAFDHWLGALAADLGPIALICGNRQEPPAPGITLLPAAPYDRTSAGSRLRTWGRFTWQALAHLRRLPSVPLFAVSNPPFMMLAPLLLRRPFALLEWDIYPQILAPMGLAGPRNPFYLLWHALHRLALRRAGLIITLSDEMAALLRTMAGRDDLPLHVIPNWVDTGWIRPLPRTENPFARAHFLVGADLVVGYSGNLGAIHAVESIVALAAALVGEPAVRFLVIGEGTKQSVVADAVTAGRTPNLTLLPYQPLDQLPYSLAAMDVGIVTMADGYGALSMPSKTYNILAAGSALLGLSRAPNGLTALLDRHGGGANFAPDDVTGAAAWLRRLLANPGCLASHRAAARRGAETAFSRDHCEAAMNAAVATWLGA